MIGYLKLGAAVVVLGLLAWLGFIVNGWRQDAALVPVLEDRIVQANAQIASERQAVATVQLASKGFQDELATLRSARAAAPARSVRLCVVPATAASAGPRTGEPGSDGATTGAGQLPPVAGPDIGADLYAIADRADDLVAQCRGLQNLERSREAQ